MGDAQSAQREGRKDAAAEEESGKVDDAQAEQITGDKPLKNNAQITELNGKADGLTEVNGHCEDEIAAEAIISPDGDVLEKEKPLKEEDTPSENVEICDEKAHNEVDANEDEPLEMIEMDAKQNDINEGFRRFFSNIGLKLTVKRGSSEIGTEAPDKTSKEEPGKPQDVDEPEKETTCENAEQNTDMTTAPETYDNDSTTCPTLTDATSEDVLETAEEKTTETKEEVESDNADAATTPPVGEDAHQDAVAEAEEDVVSPIKRFFQTGIFSGLKKKKKPAEDETPEKELVDMGKKDEQEEFTPDVEAAAGEAEHKENELKEDIQSAASAQTTDDGKSSSTVTEPEKVQASPLKRLLSGSSLKKLSKKQRSRRSSDAKLSDSGEHVSDQLVSSTESAENRKEESPVQPSAAGEEDSAWASFKKLMTPKKRMKTPSLTSDEIQAPAPAEEPKSKEGERISDHSTEEGRKRKDSSVSWEAVLCGSGRSRRSRKTSDSEDETPQADDRKQDDGSKQVAESPLGSSNEHEQAEGPPEGDGSTWKSFKRLVTPKRKAKDEEESKEITQSDGEVPQDESSFSIKKLLPGRKKRKSAEKQDQISSDEADRDALSGDEDSETPAVVPLSEFDIPETEVHIQTQAEIESHQTEDEPQQDLLDQKPEPVLPCESLETEAIKIQDSTLEKQATIEEAEDLTESTSKHKLLSDIPEEGIITETMATPASGNEEAARDDTIAEDLVEITSEAFTAPEPASGITVADETEMISAVSQLSTESSKTSGNTTPVPAEYVVMETDTLLHQVAEIITPSTDEVPVSTEELNAVGSVSPQILETLVKEVQTILTETPQTESISESNDIVSTEIPTAEFDTAETVSDETSEVYVSHPDAATSTEKAPEDEEIITDVGSQVDAETEPQIKCAQEVETATVADGTEGGAVEPEVQTVKEKEEEIVTEVGSQVDAEIEPQIKDSQEVETTTVADGTEEGAVEPEVQTVTEKEEEIVTEVGSQVDAETEPQKMDNQEVETATVEDDTEEGAGEPEVQPVKEKEQDMMPSTTDQIQVEDEDQPPAEAATLSSKVDSVELHETKLSEDTPAAEVSVEQEKEEEVMDEAKTVQEPEAEQLPALDTEDGSVQSPEKEAVTEDVIQTEVIMDEPKEETPLLTEDCLEPVDVSKIEAEALETLQTTTIDSGESGVQSHEKEETSAHVPEVEAVADETKTEDAQEPVAEQTRDSEDNRHSSLEKEVTSDDIAVETVADEPKQKTEVIPEEKEAAKTEHVQEPEVLPSDAKDTVNELQSTDKGSVQELKQQTLAEDISKQDSNDVIASVPDEVEGEDVAQLDKALDQTENQKNESTPQDAQVEQEDLVPEVADEFQTLTAVHLSSVSEQTSHVQVLENAIFSEKNSAPSTDNAAVTSEPRHEVHLSRVQVSVEQEKESEIPGTETKTALVSHAVVAQIIVCDLKDVPVSIPDVLIETSTEVTEPLIDKVASQQAVSEEIEGATAFDNRVETAEEGIVTVMKHVPLVKPASDHRIQLQVVDVDIKSAETIVESVLKVGSTETKEVIDLCQETTEKEKFSATSEIEDDFQDELNKVTIQEVIQHVKEELPEAEPESQPDATESESSKVEDQQPMEDHVKPLSETQDGAPDVMQMQQVSNNVFQLPEIPGGLDDDVTLHKEDVEETKAEEMKSQVGVTTEVKTSEELHLKNNQEQAQITHIAQSQIAIPSNTGLVVPQNTGIISSIGNVESPSSLSLEFKLNIQFGQTMAPASPPPPAERCAPAKQTVVSEVGVQAVEIEEPITPKASASTPPPTEAAPPVKQTDVSEVGVQAEGLEQPVKPKEPAPTEESAPVKKAEVSEVGIQAVETEEPTKPKETASAPPPAVESAPVKQTEVSEVKVQEVEIEQPVKEKAPASTPPPSAPVKQTEVPQEGVQAVDSEEPAKPTLQAAEPESAAKDTLLLDVGMQEVETVDLIEQIKSTERVTSSVQAAETIEPVKPIEQREVFLSQPVLSEACDRDTKEEEPVDQTEEENDQDVWMDAEEVIYTQEETETSPPEAEQPQTGGDQEEKAGQKVAQEEGSQEEMHKSGGTCEIESEGEDFAAALEDLETATASVTTMEWD